jgi:hypothetical protein
MTNKKSTLVIVVAASLALAGFFLLNPSSADAKKPSPTAGHISASDIKWMDGPPSLPAGAKMALLYGNPKKTGSFTMRLKFPANYKIPAHWHPVNERITILKGVLNFGLGKKLDAKKAGPLAVGAHGWVFAKEPHFAFTKNEGATIQLDAVGPWGITYINPKDDPRKNSKK